MEISAAINELAAALAAAQGEITGALKESNNPFFKSRYADLASVIEASREPLAKHGLCVIQAASSDDLSVTVTTLLVHSSGQWVRESLRMVPKDISPQGFGSALSYARRYARAAMVGIAQVDDDAEVAQDRNKVSSTMETTPKQMGYAREFAKSVRKVLQSDQTEEDRAAEVQKLKSELNEDQVVFAATWGLLNSLERKAFKTYCEVQS